MKSKFIFVILILAVIAIWPATSRADALQGGQAVSAFRWTTAAKLRHGLRGWAIGTLKFDPKGIEFQSSKIRPLRWTFMEIQTVNTFPRQVVLVTYAKRGRFRPGSRRYCFVLSTAMPPLVAAELAERVGRPSRNGNPESNAPAFATISARHRTAFGGTRSNGVLRFDAAGIEYITRTPKDSRAWRWADLQTVSSTDAYHLTVFGYRDTYSFDLKQPITQRLLERLTDQIYHHQPLDAGAARYSGE